MLGTVAVEGHKFAAYWTDDEAIPRARAAPYQPAVKHVATHHVGGLRFHDLRHSYATWLVDDGEPPTMVMRVMGHEKITTTLELYARRTDDADRILQALTDDDTEERLLIAGIKRRKARPRLLNGASDLAFRWWATLGLNQ